MPKKTPEPSFEQLYTELEATIEKLEAGNLALDDALALYERGMELSQLCSTLLDRAELRIQELAPNSMGTEDEDLDLELPDTEQDE